MSLPVYIVEEIGAVAARVETALYPTLGKHIYYMYGHPLEIVKRLQELSNSTTQKAKKFPLIALFTDVPVTVNGPVGFYGTARMQIIIANDTDANYTAEQRLTNNFKPILHKIKDAFIQALVEHRQFTFESEPSYTEIDRYYWGKQGLYGNEGNIFNDYIDCIELQNLEVNIKNKIC